MLGKQAAEGDYGAAYVYVFESKVWVENVDY